MTFIWPSSDTAQYGGLCLPKFQSGGKTKKNPARRKITKIAAPSAQSGDFDPGIMNHDKIAPVQALDNRLIMNPSSTAPLPPESAATGWALIFGAWLIATVSTLGALFLGEVMGYTPCVLCWYQRIAMFPLVFVLAAGLFPFDRRVVRYALPLALAGLGLALYHLALIAGWVPENLKPCQQGIPCSEPAVVWFGFISIPLLSVLSFLLVVGLLLATHCKGSK